MSLTLADLGDIGLQSGPIKVNDANSFFVFSCYKQKMKGGVV